MNTPPSPTEKTDRVRPPNEHDLDAVDVDQVDGKSVRYLRVLDDEDGSSSTTAIRKRTGFTKSAVHYRHDKLADLGLVEIERPDDRYDGKSTITATLTATGRALVDSDVFAGDAPNFSLEQLESRIDGISGAMKSQREDLERRIDDVETANERLVDFADDTLRRELEVHRVAITHLLDRLDELESSTSAE